MTKKLKKRVKRISIGMCASLLGITTAVVVNTSFFDMPEETTYVAETIAESYEEENIEIIKGNPLPEGESPNLEGVNVAEDGAIICDSLVQGAKENNLPDGNYIFRVTWEENGENKNKDYPVEIINFHEDITYSLEEGQTSKTISLGDETTEYKTLIVKYHKNLKIEKGIKLTATNVNKLTYKKGMYICVLGELTNNGTISMTARGTYNQAGEDVYLWKNIDNSYEYVPAIGGAGAVKHSYYSVSGTESRRPGGAGTNGTNRQTGGGGEGAVNQGDTSARFTTYSGAGSAGTSYSGGSGGGGFDINYRSTTYYANDAQGNGGAGGAGRGLRYSSSWASRYGGGGAGNLGGIGGTNASGNDATYSGENGTGGLLIIYSGTLKNQGTINSNGSNGGGAVTARAGGGSSGGGSVNIFSERIVNEGNVTAKGGIAVGTAAKGGAGGNGSVTTIRLMPYVNYTEKELMLKTNETYQINLNQISLVDQNGIQTEEMVLGEIRYEAVDSSIADVDENGNIVAKIEGKTKIKITDITNNLSTYIYVEVKDDRKVDIDGGKNFTVALKQNGTVWAYGTNKNGELGVGDNDNKLEPTKVEGLNDIKSVKTGYSHTLALTEAGEVYSFGLGTSGQLGNGASTSSNVPVKIENLSNIIKIDAYKNMSIALDKDGNVYTWGAGYTATPTRLDFSQRVVSVSGGVILAENGKVYNITDLSTRIAGLYNIAKISCGETHNIAISTDGIAFTWGTNTYGECGDHDADAKKAIGIADEIYEISAGNTISMLLSEKEKAYVLGNNSNGQIGLGSTAKTSNVTAIDVGRNIENISAGEGTHSNIISKDGSIFSTGLNTAGELGTGDNTNKTVYSQVGKTEIKANYEKVYLDIGEQVTITPSLENTFNLKTDFPDNNPDNFSISLKGEEKVELNGKTITAIDYGKTVVEIKHNETGITKELTIVVAVKMESIVQGFAKKDLPDGEYYIVVNEQEYIVELVNYYDDVTYSLGEGETSKLVSLGDNTQEYKTLVVKYHKNLTIDKGVTLTANNVDSLTYKKGMYLCVLGEMKNYGTISMTARGTYNQKGENVYLWKNTDNTYEYVPAEGGKGGVGASMNSNGDTGKAGSARATGGGGAGGSNGTSALRGGHGGRGTAYSGGSGGGGVYHTSATGVAAGDGSNIGGPGGYGSARSGSSSYPTYASGGAGNKAGTGGYVASSGTATSNAPTQAENGTGGLLIIYADTLYNKGEIEAKGSNVNIKKYSSSNRIGGGGASGGGSVNIFANYAKQVGNIESKGGTTSVNTSGITYYSLGGAGGSGSTTVTILKPYLNYTEKEIVLQENTNYQIDKNQITLVKQNELQTGILTLGTLQYEVLDTTVAEIDANGNVTAKAEGKTKIKITDTTNNLYTYIYIEVTNTPNVGIDGGKNFTVAVKQNGTVWSSGLNSNGQLGIGTNEDKTEATKIDTLTNITEVKAGTSHALALSETRRSIRMGITEQMGN